MCFFYVLHIDECFALFFWNVLMVGALHLSMLSSEQLHADLFLSSYLSKFICVKNIPSTVLSLCIKLACFFFSRTWLERNKSFLNIIWLKQMSTTAYVIDIWFIQDLCMLCFRFINDNPRLLCLIYWNQNIICWDQSKMHQSD